MLNLLPWRETSLRAEKNMMFSAMVISVFVTALFLSIFRHSLNVNLNKILKSNFLFTNYILQATKLKQDIISELMKQQSLVLFDKKLDLQRCIINVLNEIAHLLPANSALLSMKFDKKGVQLEGIQKTSSHQAMKQFVLNLQKKIRKTAVILQLKQTNNENINFKIWIAFK